MRIRTIKPDYFKNESLAEMPHGHRLLFIGLWCMADCKGRLEDRPKRILAEVFPYEPGFQIEPALADLEAHGFIKRYESQGLKVVEICTFGKHQRLSGTEASYGSKLPDQNGQIGFAPTPQNRVHFEGSRKWGVCANPPKTTKDLKSDETFWQKNGGEGSYKPGWRKPYIHKLSTSDSDLGSFEPGSRKPSETTNVIEQPLLANLENTMEATTSSKVLPMCFPNAQERNNRKERIHLFSTVLPDQIPEALSSPEFRQAWSDYERYRAEKKIKPLLPRSIKAKFEEMATWGQAAAIRQIRATIANGWTGIFEPTYRATPPAGDVKFRTIN